MVNLNENEEKKTSNIYKSSKEGASSALGDWKCCGKETVNEEVKVAMCDSQLNLCYL